MSRLAEDRGMLRFDALCARALDLDRPVSGFLRDRPVPPQGRWRREGLGAAAGLEPASPRPYSQLSR